MRKQISRKMSHFSAFRSLEKNLKFAKKKLQKVFVIAFFRLIHFDESLCVLKTLQQRVYSESSDIINLYIHERAHGWVLFCVWKLKKTSVSQSDLNLIRYTPEIRLYQWLKSSRVSNLNSSVICKLKYTIVQEQQIQITFNDKTYFKNQIHSKWFQYN